MIFEPPSDDEVNKINIEISHGREEYDPFEDPYQIARRNVWNCIVPQPNQLFIDIDTEDQLKEFNRRLGFFTGILDGAMMPSSPEPYTIEELPSPSGGQHMHIVMTFHFRTFTDIERIAYQAALGDDPTRVWLSVARVDGKFDPPVTFFQPKN